MERSSWFGRLATLNVVYLLFVIAFGAWVRISFSGDGCGDDWPLCRGELVPDGASAKTLVEYTHRVTSGICGIFVLGLLGWSAKRNGRSAVTWAALAMVFFVGVEALVGRSLVKLRLVAEDASVLRAWVIGGHLVNTLLLMASAAATAWLGGAGFGWRRGRPRVPGWAMAGAGLGVLVTAAMGAVTALGDTLFPVGSEAARGATEHFLVQLRVVHPAVAVGAILYLGWFAMRLHDLGGQAGHYGRVLGGFVFAQLLVGPATILLGAPAPMQLLHLMLAQGLWISGFLACLAASDARS